MRVEDGKTLTTDGPFAELKEAIGADSGGQHGRALALVHDDAERRLLERRLAELGPPAG